MAESLRTSKDNNEKPRRKQRSRDKGEMSESKNVDNGRLEVIPECAVCLQTCVHPARLPCSHIFCFLCLKGLATQSRRCAMCRQDIPLDYLDHPNLLDVPTQPEKEVFEDGYQWFYEGRSGWWQYDERTSKELEAAYKGGQRTCELLIVGQLYIADFDAMLQLRRNDMSRRRRIKRDLASIPKKGIAGLRLDGASSNTVDNVNASEENLTSEVLASNRTAPNLSQPNDSSSISAVATHSEVAWQNDQGADFIVSNDYRQMRQNNESEDSHELTENVSDTQDEGLGSDDTELENQIRDLRLC